MGNTNTKELENRRIVQILNGIDSVLDYVRDPMGKLAISDIKAKLQSRYKSFESSQESYRKDHKCKTDDGKTVHVTPTGTEVYQDGAIWRRVADDEPYVSEKDTEEVVTTDGGDTVTNGDGDPVTVAMLKQQQIREKIQDPEELQERVNDLARAEREVEYEPVPRSVFTEEENLNMDANPDLSLVTWMIADDEE